MMSMLQHPALSRLWGGAPANNNNDSNPVMITNVNTNPAPNPIVHPMSNNQPVHPPRNPPKPNLYGSRNHSASNLLTTAASGNGLALPHDLERSQSPHSVDGGTARPRRKNRERRGTENSLPVTFNPEEFSEDLVGNFRKDLVDLRKDSTPTGTEYRKGVAKLDATTDYQVPFPQVTDMASTGSNASRGRRTGAPPAINSNEQRDWEREQALRSPTLSAHSNTSSSHTTAPTSVSTGVTTANSSAGASAITIPGAYETGSGSGGSGVEVTPTRETATKTKRGSAGSASATAANNNTNAAAAGNNNNTTTAPAGFYTQQQLAQHLPPSPSPVHMLQQQQQYRASPPPPLPTGSPQTQPPIRTVPGGSPSQAPRQAYAPPPPAMAPAAPSSNGSVDSYDAPTLSNRSSFMTTATSNSLPTLPDSPPSPEELLRSPPFMTQHLTQPMTGLPHPVQTSLASILTSQTSAISPIHPRPMNRAPASVLGQTKMQESWTAAPPPEDLDDEIRERSRNLGAPRDGATQRNIGHRGTGGGSMEMKDGSWVQVPGPERQGSMRRPKAATQDSTASVPPLPVHQQSTGPAPAMARTATMPVMRYETMSPPPIREQHSGLHLEFEGKPMPEKPAPAPSRVNNNARGPSPVPMHSPNGPRGREVGRAPTNGTPPYTYEDPAYGRARSSSHNTYTTAQSKPPPPPPATQQWATRAPGAGIVPFNEDLDHDEHEQQPVPPVMQHTLSSETVSGRSIVDWANHTQSQHPLTHPNQPQPVPPGLGPIPQPPNTAASGERARGRSRSRSRTEQAQVQAPLMDPASMYSQQSHVQNAQTRSPEMNGPGRGGAGPIPDMRGRSPVPVAASTTKGNTGSGSSETEDLKTPRSPSVPLPTDNNYPRFGYGQFSVGPPTINHIYTQDLGQNGQMYPSMGFAQSQHALHYMGAGSQGMMAQMNGYPQMQMNGHQANGRQSNGSVGSGRDGQSQQNGYVDYGYPQDMSSSASGSFLNGWSSNQMDGRGYPNHIRPSAPVPPTPSTGTAPTSVSGDIRNGTQGRIAQAQTVLYNAQSQMLPQQGYPPYNYAQAQMSYAMDPYRAPSVVSSFMASPFSHNPFLPPVEPQSTQSSPSHQPVGLPYIPGPTAKKFGGARMGTKSMGRRRRMMEEFRPESTVPNDTASEAETEGKRVRDDGAETEFETETEIEEVWLEESDDDELDNEFHPTYFVNPAKRKRRFEQKWEQMVRLFREIDRETDATMILAAAPPDQHQTHLLLSRSILRSTHYSHTAQEARSVFSEISVARRHERTETLRRARLERQRKKAVDDRLAQVTHMAYAAQQANDQQGGGSGSDETSVPQSQNEVDLRSALDAAVVSLQEMRRVFDDMETRHREESNRRKEESLSIEKLLTTLLAGKTAPQQTSS